MEWEVYRERETVKYGLIENGKIKEIGEKRSSGEAYRVIVDGKTALVAGKRIDEGMKELAVKLAKVSDDHLKEFPEREKLDDVRVFDEKIEKIDVVEILDYCERIAVYDNIATAVVEFGVLEREVVNSRGVEYNQKETTWGIVVESVYRGGSAYEYQSSRKIDFEPEEYVERAIELAKLDSMRTKIESGSYTVTFSPIAIEQLLTHALFPAFYYENVIKGRSVLAEKVGEEVFGELTVKDDPLIDWGLNSCSFDDEGVKTSRKLLVDNGVLKGFISDLKSNPENAGNGFREDYTTHPATSPSNIVLEHPERGEERGEIYVHAITGAHTANFVSGDFSVEVSSSDCNGRGIKGAMIYGNVYEVLRNISHFGREKRQVGVIVTPEITIEGIEIRM